MAIYNDVVTLYNTVLKEIAYNENQYKKYLDISAIHYKHSFSNTVLIYAEKPSSKALATFKGWTDIIGRKINKGAKGIPLFGVKDGKPMVRYYFDISDTNGASNTLPIPWEITSESETGILDYFSEKTNVPFTSLPEFLTETIENEIKEFLPKNFEDFITQNETLAYENFIDSFYTLEFNSIKYRIFKRCGLDVSDITFPDIEYYQNTKLSIFLGSSSSLISTKILKNIETAITAINERSKKDDRELRNEISVDRRGSANSRVGYESIQEADREIWYNGEQLSSREISNEVRRTNDDGTIRRDSISNQSGSSSNFGTNNRSVIENETTEESTELYGNTPTQEEYSEPSRGIRTNSHNLREKVKVEEQLSLFSYEVIEELKSLAIEKEVIEPKEFTKIELNKLKFSVLKYGTGNIYDKYRIHEEIESKNMNSADFLSITYKNAGYPAFELELDSNKTATINTDSSGFQVLVPNKEEVFFTYTEAIEVIQNNQLVFYYNETEREMFRNLEVAMLAAPLDIKKEIYSSFEDNGGEITSDNLNKLLFEKTWEVNCFGLTSIACENNVVFNMGFSKTNYRTYETDYSNIVHNFTYVEISDMLGRLISNFDYLGYGKFDKLEELNHILRRGGAYEGGAVRTYEYFIENHSQKDKISFLKKEFGEGGCAGTVLLHKEHGGYDTFGKGIHIHCDLYPDNDYKITWSEAVKTMDKLFEDDAFFTESQKSFYHAVNDLASYLFQEYYNDLPDFTKYGYTFENSSAVSKLFEDKIINYPLSNGQLATADFSSYAIKIKFSDINGNTSYSRLCELFKCEAQRQIVSDTTPKVSTSYEKRIYQFFKENYPEILSGTYTYMNYHASSSSYMPLTLESVPEGKTGVGVSISHYYTQDGDLMYDPEIVFAIDMEKEEAYPHSFTQDNLNRYELVYDGKTDNEILGDEISDFFLNTWCKNLKANNYILTSVTTEEGEHLEFSDENNEIEAEAFEIKAEENPIVEHTSPTILTGIEYSKSLVNGVPYIDETLTKENIIELMYKNLHNTPLIQDTIIDYLKNNINSSLNEKINYFKTVQSLCGNVFFIKGIAGSVSVLYTDDHYARLCFHGSAFEDIEIPYETYFHNILEKISNNELVVSTLYAPETIAAQQETFLNKLKKDTITSNFHIDDSFDLYSGAKSKFKQNIDAINLLHTLQNENRAATPQEQSILAKYSGWGGLANAFDSSNLSWQEEYKTLKELLSVEDYKAARESTLTSYYTDKPVIDFIYSSLIKFGFNGGNILEPALGVGNFYGRLPNKLSRSKLYGVEVNSISGNIAKYLYPSANIIIDGFENAPYEENYFDVIVGNVPFGDYKVFDNKYNKYNFLIHDYFFAKALDNLKPGGILAFITSAGTLDKANPSVRKYLSERAELIGAIRLPNNSFKKIAGTEVTSDIIFLKKKQTPCIDIIEPNWIATGYTEDGFIVNQYFIDNPQMILGKIDYDTRYGKNERNTLCVAPEGFNLEESLKDVLKNLNAEIKTSETPVEKENNKLTAETLPADPNVRNFTYCIIDNQLYYRENSEMHLQDLKGKVLERIKGLHEIRTVVREIIDIQTLGCTKEELIQKQSELNTVYDTFIKKHGYITSKENKRAFIEDNDYPLLSSLEYMDEKENILKADIFTKQTINPYKEITSVDTPSEALMVALNIKGKIDIPYMCNLCNNISPNQLIEELAGQIYINPEKYSPETFYDALEPADEYLSGNVREKLIIAKAHAADTPDLFYNNVLALEKVQPEEIEAADIRVKLGVNWIDIEDYESFMYETCNTPIHLQKSPYRKAIAITYNKYDSSWSILNKALHSYSITVTETYGTTKMSAYQIIEESLNQREAVVRDRVDLDDGKYKYVINRKETELSKEKQALLQEKFREWLFSDTERREKYVKIYNEKFNSIRLRDFDGSFQTFPNMNPEIKLRKHQLSAIARAKFNGNTLLAHAVGAGKTFEMDAIIMEKKRLGLIQKACMVVPNHLTDQAATELLTLYPSANILLTTKKDFEKANRQRFISKIATGEYDCVIMGSSQFEKIPMSKKYQEEILNNDLDEIMYAIENLDTQSIDEASKRYSVKQLEKARKSIENKLEILLDDSRKDDLITFEQLGFDFLAVDEAHNYKNCSIFTKMHNIAGISDIGAKKSYDLLMKCKYINELTGYKNIVFATGTPVANSMTELFTMTKYLRPDILDRQGLLFFDNWAALYGEVISSLELAPAGNGFRLRQRFAKFVNLPELLISFKEFADVQTADMLNLPIPELKSGKPITVTAEPDETQKVYIDSLAERMEVIHNGGIDPSIDNALKITHEARLLGTDARLILPDAQNNPGSKVNLCINNIYDIYVETSKNKSSQIVFCDVGTPKPGSKNFILYDYIKNELMQHGIPEDEIAFAHDAKNEKERAIQFSNIRNGNIRVIIASTAKMGTGANIQKNLVALHHLDIPWRPSDIEQRNGRILRQGNENKEVAIYQYVTKGTFDAYMWSTLENKQKFISQIMNSKAVARSCEDIDESVLNYAEVKAIATGDPRIKEKMELDMDINRLQTLKSSFISSRHRLQDSIDRSFPLKIRNLEQKIELIKIDIEQYNKVSNSDFYITFNGLSFTEREPAGEYLFTFKKEALKSKEPIEVGEYKGYKLYLSSKSFGEFDVIIKGAGKYPLELSDNHLGSILKIDNVLKSFDTKLNSFEVSLNEAKKDLENAKLEFIKPFPHEEDLMQKIKRQIELNSELDLDKVDSVTADENLEQSSSTIDEIEEDEETINITENVSNENINVPKSVMSTTSKQRR